LPGTALIIALLLPPPLHMVAPALSVHDLSAEHSQALGRARLVLWGTQVSWSERWGVFATPEVPNYGVAPVWERYETPSPDAEAPAPSFIVMREMDCRQGTWRTTGVVSYPSANLKGEARFERSGEGWRAPETTGDTGSIYRLVCRR
jgi:hypothetical protein